MDVVPKKVLALLNVSEPFPLRARLPSAAGAAKDKSEIAPEKDCGLAPTVLTVNVVGVPPATAELPNTTLVVLEALDSDAIAGVLEVKFTTAGPVIARPPVAAVGLPNG